MSRSLRSQGRVNYRLLHEHGTTAESNKADDHELLIAYTNAIMSKDGSPSNAGEKESQASRYVQELQDEIADLQGKLAKANIALMTEETVGRTVPDGLSDGLLSRHSRSSGYMFD